MQLQRSKRAGAIAITATALSLTAWLQVVSANIAFVQFPPNTMVKPGDRVTVSWTLTTNNTVENNAPFRLELRALTGQQYDLQDSVAQDLRQVVVTIPKEATGGKHSFYAGYSGPGPLPKMISSNQVNITGNIVTTTSGAPGPTGSTSGSTSNPTGTGNGKGTSDAAKDDAGISGGALAGIIGGAIAVLLGVVFLFFCRHRRRNAAVGRDDGPSVSEKERGYNGGYDSKDQDKEQLTRAAGSGGGPMDDGMVNIPLHGPPAPRSTPRPEEEPHQNQSPAHYPPQQQPPHMMHNAHAPPPGAAGPRNPFDSQDPLMANARMSPRMPNQSPRMPNQSPRMPNQSPRDHQYQPPTLSPYAEDQPQPYGVPSPMMAPHQSSPHQQSQNPFQQRARESIDTEIESAYDPHPRVMNQAAAGPMARGAAPMLSHSASGRSLHDRAQQSPLQDPRSQSPMMRNATMDVQQHHMEQQQRMLQRQQQQQQSPVQEQPISPVLPVLPVLPKPIAPAPLPAAQKSINPTQFDDKAEVEEDSGPIYNGYRDTIFGAYAQTADDDEDDEPVPAMPTTIVAQANATVASAGPTTVETGPVEIQRKKSVKFTGVPVSGPVVLPNQGAAKDHQAQKIQQRQQTQGADVEEDENDIKRRLIQAEVPASAGPPAINTTVGASSSANVLSPVRSPDQEMASSPYGGVQQGGFAPPPPAQPDFDDDEDDELGNDFYEDVLAAVNRKSVLPDAAAAPTTTAAPVPMPAPYPKPMMPPVPQSSPPPPQQYIQQQHIASPQLQHFQPLNKEVFGAPSPRISPAAPTSPNAASSGGYIAPPPVLTPKAAPRPPVAPQQQQQDGNFYESNLL